MLLAVHRFYLPATRAFGRLGAIEYRLPRKTVKPIPFMRIIRLRYQAVLKRTSATDTRCRSPASSHQSARIDGRAGRQQSSVFERVPKFAWNALIEPGEIGDHFLRRSMTDHNARDGGMKQGKL
jgi:hypothetical protein